MTRSSQRLFGGKFRRIRIADSRTRRDPGSGFTTPDTLRRKSEPIAEHASQKENAKYVRLLTDDKVDGSEVFQSNSCSNLEKLSSLQAANFNFRGSGSAIPVHRLSLRNQVKALLQLPANDADSIDITTLQLSNSLLVAAKCFSLDNNKVHINHQNADKKQLQQSQSIVLQQQHDDTNNHLLQTKKQQAATILPNQKHLHVKKLEQANPQHLKQQANQQHLKQQANQQHLKQQANQQHLKQQANQQHLKQQADQQHLKLQNNRNYLNQVERLQQQHQYQMHRQQLQKHQEEQWRQNELSRNSIHQEDGQDMQDTQEKRNSQQKQEELQELEVIYQPEFTRLNDKSSTQSTPFLQHSNIWQTDNLALQQIHSAAYSSKIIDNDGNDNFNHKKGENVDYQELYNIAVTTGIAELSDTAEPISDIMMQQSQKQEHQSDHKKISSENFGLARRHLLLLPDSDSDSEVEHPLVLQREQMLHLEHRSKGTTDLKNRPNLSDTQQLPLSQQLRSLFNKKSDQTQSSQMNLHQMEQQAVEPLNLLEQNRENSSRATLYSTTIMPASKSKHMPIRWHSQKHLKFNKSALHSQNLKSTNIQAQIQLQLQRQQLQLKYLQEQQQILSSLVRQQHPDADLQKPQPISSFNDHQRELKQQQRQQHQEEQHQSKQLQRHQVPAVKSQLHGNSIKQIKNVFDNGQDQISKPLPPPRPLRMNQPKHQYPPPRPPRCKKIYK